MFIDFLAVSLSLIKYYFVSTENHFARGSFVWATVCHHQETWSTRPGRLVLGSITGRAPLAPAWVLHRMSSDLIIMDIWSSHSLSLRLQIIKQYWHYLTANYYPFTSAWTLSIIIANMETWKLGFARQQEQKQNKASYCRVSCAK